MSILNSIFSFFNSDSPKEPLFKEQNDIKPPTPNMVTEPDEKAMEQPSQQKPKKKKPIPEETKFLFRDLIPYDLIDKAQSAEEIVPLTNFTTGVLKEFSEGDILGTFSSNGSLIELKAPLSGYYTCMPLFSILNLDSIACFCYPTTEKAKYYGAIPDYSLTKDPVSSSFSLFWNEVNSFCDAGSDIFFPLVWGFTIKGDKPVIYFHNEKKSDCRQRR